MIDPLFEIAQNQNKLKAIKKLVEDFDKLSMPSVPQYIKFTKQVKIIVELE